MRKAALYARVSSDIQQKERTIESQIAELKRQIQLAGDVLVKEYVDDGYSGALLDRPAISQFREDIKTDLFEVVYFLNADRIARDVTYQNIIVGEILWYRKQIIINNKDYVQNPENKFTLTVLGAVSELERAKYIERTSRGKLHRLRQGHLLSQGAHIYGYTYTPRGINSFPKYEINESEAKIIRLIFEKYENEETGYKPLARFLREMKVSRRNNKQWSFTAVKLALQNETYTGIRYFNTMVVDKRNRGRRTMRDRAEWIGIPIPQIVSKELFDKVQEKIKHNRTCYRNAKRKYLFSSLIWCARCNQRCFIYRRYYKVLRKDGLKICQRNCFRCYRNYSHIKEINAEIVEPTVLKMVREKMLEPLELKKNIGVLTTRKLDLGKISKQIKNLETKIKVLSDRKSRILDLYSSGDIERKEYIMRIAECDSELITLNKKQNEIAKYKLLLQKPESIETAITEYCLEAKRRFETANEFHAKRQFLLDYILKVTYRLDKNRYRISLHGLIPLRVSTEVISVEFVIEEIVDKQPMSSKANDQWLERIKSSEFGDLVNKHIDEI